MLIQDETGEDDGTAPSHTLDEDEEFDEDVADLVIPNLVAGSREWKELQGAVKGLYKVGLALILFDLNTDQHLVCMAGPQTAILIVV
jgi:hypothetical protein